MSSKKPSGNDDNKSSAIIVGVRVRPFNQREIKYNSKCIISMEKSCTRVSVVRQGKIAMEQPKEYHFDYAFWTHSKPESNELASNDVAAGSDESNMMVGKARYADQDYIYQCMGKTILENVIKGFNSCLFAYGQTGSGKTYTMMGTGSDPGVLPRIGIELFNTLDALRQDGGVATVECSFCEIHNEKVRDLMDTTANGEPPNLQIRQHPKLGVFVQGLNKFSIKSSSEFSQMLDSALSHRAVASTNMNAQSSRSHAIVLLTVAQKVSGVEKSGRMSLVDLAGSERSASTGAVGSTAQEGNNINLSLTTLGMVLSRLADKAEGKSGGHIPYRDSALTFLLSENLGGNSKTAMLANISPASLNFDETLSTLRFASITKRVRTVAIVNENPTTKLIRELKEELEKLKGQWSQMQTGGSVSEELLSNIQENELAMADVSAKVVTFDEAASVFSPQKSSFVPPLGGGENASFANPSFALGAPNPTEEEIMANHSFIEGIYIDWKLPQLINLVPDNASSVASVNIREGTNQFTVGEEQLSLHFDGLANQVTIFGSNIYLNGERVPDEGGVLRHQDRIVVGESRTVFRFAHSSGLSKHCDFERRPTCEEHLFLLERYFRWTIIEERSKDAIAIGKAYFATTDAVAAGISALQSNAGSPCTPSASPTTSRRTSTLEQEDSDPDAPPPNRRGGGGGRRRSSTMSVTPRSTNPLLATIGDDVAMSNQSVFSLERDLAELYPATTIDVAEELPPCTYDDVLTELNQTLSEKEAYIKELQGKLHSEREEASAAIASALQMEKQVEDLSPNSKDEITRAEEVLHQGTIDDEVTARAVDRDFKWHRKVKNLRKFKTAGPQDPIDLVMWKRLTDNPPFLGDQQLCLQRTAAVHFIDPANGVLTWENRCLGASKRFLFLFRKADGRERCHCAVYLLGCTVNSIMEEGKHVLEITPACPRSVMDSSISGQQAQIKLAFGTPLESFEWRKWIEQAAVPSMPYMMRKRQVRESLTNASGPTVHVDTVGAPAISGKLNDRHNWKPDSEANNCAACNAPFVLLFRRRHHCRVCGDIFCSQCMINKKCKNCTETFERDDSSFIEIETVKKNVLKLRPAQIPSGEDLVVQDFLVRIGSREAEQILFRVDLYSNRVHTCLADEIRIVERCPRDPMLLLLILRDHTSQHLYFRNAIEREHCYEGIMALIGHRLYVPGVQDLANESDILIYENEPGSTMEKDALLLATSAVSSNVTAWVGLEDGRTVPFHRDFGIWAILGHQETWNDETLKTFRLSCIASVPLHKTSHLYIVASDEWKDKVLKISPSPAHTKTDKKICAVGVHLLETTILFVAIETVYDDEFVAISSTGSSIPPSPSVQSASLNPSPPPLVNEDFDLSGVTVMNLPAVDPIMQYDHVVVVGLGTPAPLREFTTVTGQGNVQFRSSSMAAATVKRAERTTALLDIPVVNVQFSRGGTLEEKKADNPDAVRANKHLLVELVKVTSEDGAAEFAQPCELWTNIGFDRVDTDSNELMGTPSRDVSAQSDSKNPFKTLLFANSLPEYTSSQNIYLVVPEMGTAAIPIASFSSVAGEDIPLPCEVFAGGFVQDVVIATIRCQWVEHGNHRNKLSTLFTSDDYGTPVKK